MIELFNELKSNELSFKSLHDMYHAQIVYHSIVLTATSGTPNTQPRRSVEPEVSRRRLREGYKSVSEEL